VTESDPIRLCVTLLLHTPAAGETEPCTPLLELGAGQGT
jgi:hypothetical protein